MSSVSTLVLTQDEAERLLEPLKSMLSEHIRAVFDDWSAVLAASPKQTAGLTHKTQRPFLHERIVRRLAEAEASGNYPMLKVKKLSGNLAVVVIADRLTLKLKKLDKGFRSRNIATGQTQAFDNQEQLVPSSFGAMTNATTGYVPDATGAEPIHVVVVCWEGDHRHWLINLDENRGGQVVQLEVGPPPDSGDGTRTRIISPAPPIDSEKKEE